MNNDFRLKFDILMLEVVMLTKEEEDPEVVRARVERAIARLKEDLAKPRDPSVPLPYEKARELAEQMDRDTAEVVCKTRFVRFWG
ncbi:MAG TPA: hypothetical protein VJJ22_03035 [Candidatus Paceibacterota bacterium]